MTDSTMLAVVTGLVVGVAFVAISGLIFIHAPLIDNIRVDLDRGKNQQIIDIIVQDPRVIDLLKDRDVSLFFISDRSQGDQCEFGSCARVIMQTDRWFLFLSVDYANNKVIHAAVQVNGETTPIF